MENEILTPQIKIEDKILIIRGQQVMIDRDLAKFYRVETKVLNQAVKRNIERFPEDFMFVLTQSEKEELVTNCDRFNILKHSSTSPYAFTEQGVAMLASVLKSEVAVEANIQIMRAFVAVRRSHQKTAISALDIQKFNEQYPLVTLKYTENIHDRFLIVDSKILYHIGASLKDLGKKCFAFEVLDSAWIKDILKNL